MSKVPFTVTAIIPERCPQLKGVPGVTVEGSRTRMYTKLREDDNGRVTQAVAYPIEGTLMAETVNLKWELGIEPGFFFKDNGFRKAGLACSANGKYLPVKCIKVKNREGGDKLLLVGIKDAVAQVTVILGRDKNGKDRSEAWINVYRFGKTIEFVTVEIISEVHHWFFPQELTTMALVTKPGELMSRKPQIMDIIKADVLEQCSADKIAVLRRFIEPMAVAFLRACGQQGAALTKPEAVKPAEPQAPATKVEIPVPAASEAPAPEASALDTEEPIPMPPADDVPEEVATDADDYEPPELTLVPEPALNPELDPQVIAAGQAGASRQLKSGRAPKPKIEKSVKGKKRATA